MTRLRIEIREPDQAPREVVIESGVDIGRECDGVVLSDPKTSRRHLRLTAGPNGPTVADLGSTNGAARRRLRPRDGPSRASSTRWRPRRE